MSFRGEPVRKGVRPGCAEHEHHVHTSVGSRPTIDENLDLVLRTKQALAHAMSELPDVTFLSPAVEAAPYRKRIDTLRSLGVSGKTLAFDRDVGYWGPVRGNIVSLGSVSNPGYVRRLWPLLLAIPRIRAAVRQSDVAYAFGFDMALLAAVSSAFLRRRPGLVYEVHDIRNLFIGRGPTARVARAIERLLMRRVDLLVVTSEAYVSRYYEDILRVSDLVYVVMENKIDVNTPSTEGVSDLDSRHRTIGFFGSLRCPASWRALSEIASKSGGRLKIHVRGVPKGIGDLAAEAERHPHITYGGPYVDPDDLADVYRAVDLVWAAGYHAKRSYRWSRSCRFYYACHFRKPIVALADTEEGRAVEALDIGLCVDLANVPGTVERLLAVTESDMNRWRTNLRGLPPELFTYTDDYHRLLSILRKISEGARSFERSV